MLPDRRGTGLRGVAGDGHGTGAEPQVLLFMESGRNRDLLVETLEDNYRLETTTDPGHLDGEFDCCVLSHQQFARSRKTVRSKQAESEDVFLPFVLLETEEPRASVPAGVWEVVDDVIELPVKQAILSARIGNLIERRLTSVELAKREERLAETVAELRIKERAFDEAPVGLTIADMDGEDNPVVYMNEQFEKLSGYDESEFLGRDCRLLQGPETDPKSPRKLRAAIDAERPVSVDIINYRKNGQKFWNKVDVAPIRDDEGSVTNYVGFQTDITERKIRERRLEVLNRVLSHNLRNKMNVIEGHVALLREQYEDGQQPESLQKIGKAATEVIGLANTVREIDHTLSDQSDTVVALDEALDQLVSAFQDRYPDATFDLTVPSDEPYEVAVSGIMTAIEEAVENAVEHNESPEPVVEIRVSRDSRDWIDVEVEDDGPGIPEQEVRVLKQGETSLVHADRLGLWLIYWVISRAGGDFSVERAEPRGTTLTMCIPTSQ